MYKVTVDMILESQLARKTEHFREIGRMQRWTAIYASAAGKTWLPYA